MFIGHFDLIWPILVLLGIETVRIDRAASSPFLRLRFVHYPWDRAGTWAFWAFVAFLVIAYASSLAGGPPPSARGAAGTVPGSRHRVTAVGGMRVLVDGGLGQGGRDMRDRNWEPCTAG